MLTLSPTVNLESPNYLTCMFFGGTWNTQREPARARREHVNSTKKGPCISNGMMKQAHMYVKMRHKPWTYCS